jgi:hypothetical protein
MLYALSLQPSVQPPMRKQFQGQPILVNCSYVVNDSACPQIQVPVALKGTAHIH